MHTPLTAPLLLAERRVMRITGAQASTLLQGVVTANVTKLKDGEASLSALLSPQGKFLYDFILLRHHDTLMLETEARQIDGLLATLTRYRLRADVQFDILPDWHVYALPPAIESLPTGGMRYTDPRHAQLPPRLMSPHAPQGLAHTGDGVASGHAPHAYESLRLHLGIPEGWKDAVPERSFLLELGYDHLGAVDFHKGCYIGQEVTARSRYRGTLRKCLHHIRSLTGQTLAEHGASVTSASGVALGEMRSSCGSVGLAMVRREELARAMEAGEVLEVSGQPVTITPLPWMMEAQPL